ncbi:MAG: DUF1592 domain-containing protein [Labilithrix sp.]|nr:DUF1592 domain-containing protein [Labilithrix sp.]
MRVAARPASSSPRGEATPRSFAVLSLAAATTLAACMGVIGGDGDDDGRASGPGVGDDGITGTAIATLRCTTPAVGPNPIRRMTGREYLRAVGDLLGTREGLSVSETVSKDGFDNNTTLLSVDEDLSRKLFDSAVTVVENVDPDKLTGCASHAQGCVDDFLRRFARRAYRRPVTEDEAKRLLGTFQEGNAAGGFTTGVRAAVASVLASPNFIFQAERGTPQPTVPNATRASSFEIASRLSTFLWSSVPDDELLDAAARDELQTKEQIAGQAKRMLVDPRAKDAIASFYEQWFGVKQLAPGIAKDDPEFGEELRQSMRGETQRFISDILWNGDGTIASFFTSKTSFADARLAKLYGVAAPAKDWSAIKLPAERQGILTQAGFLTTFSGTSRDVSSPIKRGLTIRTKLLCLPPPKQPPAIPSPPEVSEGTTNRELLQAHVAAEPCKSCHEGFDGFGFGLEAFDATGRYASTESGKQVDASGWFKETDVDGDYDGAIALSNKLAQSRQVRDCASLQYTRYALGRLETDDDVCAIVAVRDAADATNGNVREMLLALTQTDAFSSYRKAE